MEMCTAIKSRLIQKTQLTVSSDSTDGDGVEDAHNPPPLDTEEEKRIKEVETKLLTGLPRDEYDATVRLMNKGNGGKKYKSHHVLSKSIPPNHEISVDYVAINPKHDPETIVGRLEPKRINVNAKGAAILTNDAMSLLIDKTKKAVEQVEGLTLDDALKDSFIIYCFDGAVHENTSHLNKNIITYSLTLGSYTLAKKCGVFTTSGNNICAFSQLHASECTETIGKIMETRLANATGDHPALPSNICVYDLADCKALYAMLNLSGWASTQNPYICCECNKGDSRLAGSQCVKINNAKFIALYQNSELYYWEETQRRERLGIEPYTKELHHKWCNIHNCGHTHLHRLGPDYDFESIRFDTFHGRSGTMKVMIGYIRRILDNNYHGLGQFKEYLGKLQYWDDYVIDQFLSGDTVNRLKGKHTKCFVKSVDDIIEQLKTIIDEVDIAEFCVCLKAFEKMSEILSFVFVDEYELIKHVLPDDTTICNTSRPDEIAEAVFKEYEAQAELLFTNGFLSFMERNGDGKGETLYLHILKHYLPGHMRITYQRHKLGVAIFSMEGFEYKNYTSKHIIRNRNNGRGVQVKQSLKILQLLFIHTLHDVTKELKKRK